MSEVFDLPVSRGSNPVVYGDTGQAVKKIQDFLQSLPYVVKEEEHLESFGRGYSLLNNNIYGKFESYTQHHLQQYQKFNSDRILKNGNLSSIELEKEFGQVGFATWKTMMEDMGIKKEEEKPTVTPLTQNKLPIKYPEKSSRIKIATHFVKTQNTNHRLALRKSPSYTKVGKEVYEDSDKKGELVIMMPNDTLIYIVEPGVGYNCEWNQVMVVDDDPIFTEVLKLQQSVPLYAYAEFIQPLEGTPQILPMSCEKCIDRKITSDKNFQLLNWKDLDDCNPFYDEKTCSYYIVVTLNYENTSEELIKKQKIEAIYYGSQHLLNFYDKQRESGDVNRLINSYKFGFIPENGWYIGERPGSKIKFLVGIPSKYFDAIPRKTDYLEDIPNIENGNLPSSWRTTHFYVSKLRKNIDTVISRFAEYENDMDDFEGESDINFTDESNMLEYFLPVLKEFVELNGYKFDENEDDSIEIGFEGPCFAVRYVLINQGQYSVPLRIGFECFLRKEPIIYQRTMGYIFYLDDMVESINEGKISWFNFIQKYSCPLPYVKPSKKKESKEQKKITKKFDDKPIKTYEEKQIEEEVIDDLREDSIRRREIEIDFVGDSIFYCENIYDMLNRIKNFDDVYSEILNKTNISTISLFIASCIAAKFNIGDLEEIVCDMIYRSLPYDKINKMLDLMPADDITKINDFLVTLPRREGEEEKEEDRIRASIDASVPKITICKTINLLDPDLVADYFNRLVSFLEEIKRFIHIVPTIKIPDHLFTIDIMDIVNYILATIENALSAALVSLLKTIFGKLCSICDMSLSPKPEQNFGDENINDLIKDKKMKSPRDTSKDLLDDLGFDNIDPNDIVNFLDDLSQLLTPEEICRLLNGTYNSEILNVIYALVDKKYPQLRNVLNSPLWIKNFFKKLKEYINDDFCVKLEERVKNIDPMVCDENILRKSLLEDKMSKEQLEKSLEEEKKKNKEMLKQLLNIASKNGDFLKDILPSSIDKACGQNNYFNLILKRQESFSYSNDVVQKSIFDSVKSSFNSDMIGYVYSLIDIQNSSEESNNLIDKESIKKSRKAFFKSLEDFDKLSNEDTEKLLEDPDMTGTGKGKPMVYVVPELKQLLSDNSNFTDRRSTTKEVFLFNILLSGIEKKLKDASVILDKGDLKSKYQRAVEYLKKINSLTEVEKVPVNNVVTNTNEYKDITTTDELEKLNYAKIIVNGIMPNELILEYRLLENSGENNKEEKYEILINDPSIDETLYIIDSIEMNDAMKVFVGKFSFPFESRKITMKSWFKSFVMTGWKKVLSNASRNYISYYNSSFASFWDTAYHQINLNMIKMLTKQISDSKFFNIENFLEMEFLPTMEEDSVCPYDTMNMRSLMMIEDTKNKIEKEYNKKMDSSCGDNTKAFSESFKGGIIELLIRIYVIDYILRGVFVFSKFRIKDLLLNKTLIKYFVNKVKKEIRKEGEEFYKILIEESKKMIFSDVSRKSKFELENDYKDETEPDFISGDLALEFLIKDNLNVVSSMMSDVFAVDETIYEKFMKEGIKTIDVFKKVRDVYSFLRNNSSEQYGCLVLERYKRICDDSDGIVVKITDYVNPKSKYVYGVRLSYIMPYNNPIYTHLDMQNYSYSKSQKSFIMMEEEEDFKQRMKDYEANISLYNMKVKEKEVEYLSKNPKADGLPLSELQKIKKPEKPVREKSAIIPLIEMEEGTFRTSPILYKEAEEEIIQDLKVKMTSLPEYEFLFSNVFPIKRLLSLVTIYNIISTSIIREEFDKVFDETKNTLKQLFNIIRDATEDEKWWKKEDPNIEGRGYNAGIRQEMMNNITTRGPKTNLAKMAMMTIPLFVKGMADMYDPSYKLIKRLGLPLNWGSVPAVAPINIFGPFGFGPPLLTWGAMALTVGLLPGERRKEKRSKRDKKEIQNTPEEMERIAMKDCNKKND